VPNSVAVTSAISGEGVTFMSHALAAVLSEDLGSRTCLVGANWWSVENELPDSYPGLAGLFRDGIEIDDVLIETRYERLTVIGSGTLPDPQRTMLSTTERMTALLAELRARFDHVILDLPATTTSTSALTFAAAADASLLVARQRMTRIDQVESAVADMRHTRLLGVVLNDNLLYMPRALQRRLLDA
jgi:Mrp family chromosome partitioning ATPase